MLACCKTKIALARQGRGDWLKQHKLGSLQVAQVPRSIFNRWEACLSASDSFVPPAASALDAPLARPAHPSNELATTLAARNPVPARARALSSAAAMSKQVVSCHYADDRASTMLVTGAHNPDSLRNLLQRICEVNEQRHTSCGWRASSTWLRKGCKGVAPQPRQLGG